MSGTKFIGAVATAALLAAGLTAMSGAGAKAQDSDQQPTMFGYAAPHQFLINRMMAPDQPESDDSGGQAAGQGVAGGQAGNGGQGGNGGQAAAADNGASNGYYRFPKRYLLNKMFDFGGGDSAPAAAPAAPAPAAVASAPAAKTP